MVGASDHVFVSQEWGGVFSCLRKTMTLTLLASGGHNSQVRRIKMAHKLQKVNGRGDRVRTDDLMLPKHARYQLRHAPTRDDMIPKVEPQFWVERLGNSPMRTV